MEKNKVFLDTSVIISTLLSQKGGSFYILNSLGEHYGFVINQFVLEESQRVLREKFSQDKTAISRLFLQIVVSLVFVSDFPKETLVSKLVKIISKEDAPILAGVLEAKCQYLVTLDKEFFSEKVKGFLLRKKIGVFTPKKFILHFRRTINTQDD